MFESEEDTIHTLQSPNLTQSHTTFRLINSTFHLDRPSKFLTTSFFTPSVKSMHNKHVLRRPNKGQKLFTHDIQEHRDLFAHLTPLVLLCHGHYPIRNLEYLTTRYKNRARP